MKKIFFYSFIISFLSFNLSARELDDFIYDGQKPNQSVHLSQIERLPNGQYQQIKTEAKLIFDSINSSLGKDINIEVKMNGIDVGMKASNDTNTLALLKLKKSDRWFSENTVNVLMEIEIKFLENLSLQAYPYQVPLSDLNITDDFVSFTSGKIIDSKNVMAQIQIFKKKTFGKDDLVYDGKISGSDLVVTEFGSDRSLVTVDLNKVIRDLERGKKHIIKATIGPNFGKWRAFNEDQKKLFATPEMISAESTFRY